ncbi:MAG: hypothetical protein ABIP58_03000, partial [Dehalococcoidia bacterium]
MLFRSALLSIAFLAALAIILRMTVVPPEDCGTPSERSIEEAASRAVDWMVRNQEGDGRYVYIYNAGTGSAISGYNEVRHAGVTMALYQAAGRLQDREALAAADRALVWMQDNLERRNGWAALTPDGNRPKLGASALMLVSLAERRLATGDPIHDGLMRELAAFIVTMQRQDGGFHVAYDLSKDRPDEEGTSRYYPGEALWALALTHEALPDPVLEEAAWRALDFITLRRDIVEDVKFPPLPDQWAAYGLSEMADWGLTDQQAAYSQRLAGRFGFLVRIESQRQGSWYGRMLKGGDVRASGVGTWTEALSGLWRISVRDERLSDSRDRIKERLICVAG